MDIPAPSSDKSLAAEAPKDPANAADDTTAVAVNVKTAVKPAEATPEADTKAAETPSPQSDQDKQKAVIDKDNEDRKKILELITTKKYNLDIKEKRSSPLLTVSIMPKKSKKSKHKSAQSVKSTEHKSAKKKESKNAKMIKLGVILVLWLGFYVAIDAGLIDIGWKPPFSLFGKKDSAEVLQFTGDTTKK